MKTFSTERNQEVMEVCDNLPWMRFRLDDQSGLLQPHVPVSHQDREMLTSSAIYYLCLDDYKLMLLTNLYFTFKNYNLSDKLIFS